MKRILLSCVMALMVFASAIASINEKLSGTTQLFIAERDGLISLDVKLPGPKMMSRAPLLRMQPVDRIIAPAERVNGVDMVSAFIHINPNYASKLESLGVVIQERFRDFVTAMIPVDKIERVAEIAEVKQVNVARKMKLRTNMARYYTNTDDVLNFSNDAVSAGLPQAFKGSGVVVGVIDDGIDFQHKMFQDSNGNYRIKRAYVATGSGRFSTYTSITSSSPTTDDSGESHGTHTSSTAGGSNITVSGTTYGGMAPEADLVLVGCGEYLYNTNIAAGIKYVFDYADSQNKPAVCSLSLGSHFGPHDGTGELASVYSEYAGSNPNHIIVYAAGNEAGNGSSYGFVHAEGNASSSTPFSTVLNGYAGSSKNASYYGYDVFYARTANKALACKLHVVNTSSNTVVWTSGAITSSTTSVSGVTTYFRSSPQVTISRDSYSGKYYVQLYTNASKQSSYSNSNYALAISVYPTSGSCMIDCWDVNGYNYFANYSRTISGYTFVAGCDDSSAGDESGSEDVISVGAYASKTSVRDYNNTNHSLTSYYTLGDIAYFSSYQTAGYGPTGVAKPDICAPGATIVAGINHYDSNFMSNGLSDYGYYLVYKNSNSSLGSLDGTSMATPCAAGIIALYLQAAKYAGKTLNTEGIRDVFANTAITDNYTNKNNFGRYGKIDALGGINYILGGVTVDPELTVDPQSLSFTGTVGQTYTKTFTLTGTHLTSNVNLSVSGNSNFTISPSSLTVAQAQAGATVTVTYKPTTTGTHTATVTASSTGAESVSVALNGTAAEAPSITTNPTSLSFSTTVGTAVTKTITVTGANLTGSVAVSVSGTGFSVNKTTITQNAATSGASVIVTYNPTATGTHTGTVTFTSNGAETKTVSLTGTATDVVRTINVNPASLSFEALVGQSATKTFTVSGTNLTGNLTLSLNNANGIYSIDKTSITAAQAAAGTTVTVTYNPTVAGNSNATVSITGGGAEAVTVNLSGTAVTPTITVNPTTLTFNTIVGQSQTQTFTVTGANLTGNLSLSLTNSRGAYSISRTIIGATEAANGVTVTVTFNPAFTGAFDGSVTISGGGAESVTVNLNGTSAEPPRTITASTDVLNLSAITGETVTGTFTVTGENLNGALSLELNDANGVYSIEPSTISAADALNGVTVTVTYAPTTFGNQTASIIISGGGANPVTVNLNGTANITKYAPVMQQANDAFVAMTQFRADWTDLTPEFNVSSYTLEVNLKPVVPEVVLLNSFDGTTYTGSYADITLPAPWGGTNVRGGNNAIYFRNNYEGSNSPGNITYTIPEGYNNATFTLKLTTATSNYGAGYFVVATPQTAAVGHNFAAGETYSWVVTASAGEQITITTTDANYSADIALIEVYTGDATANRLMAIEQGGTDYRLITEIDPARKFYIVKDLLDGGTFLYRVKALYIDGTESEWSNLEEVTLHENDHPFQGGDVNHDGYVDVDDITALIAAVLGTDSNICIACADVNGDENVDVDDVTALIGIVLGNTSRAAMLYAQPLYVK